MMRILVVQADEGARARQSDLLSGAQLTVAAAGSGAEALEKVRADPPDLVVLGRSLPDMDGLDLLPQLKGTHDQFTPVLVASHRSETSERLLRAVGTEITRSLRTPDVAARYGGDEFAVILPQTQPEGALRVCERIHGALQRLTVTAGEEQVSITASLGVADYPSNDIACAEDLIHAADEALYGAKRGGKNRYSAVRALGGARSSGIAPVMSRAPRS